MDNYIFSLEAIKQARLKILEIIDAHTIDELNTIPEGFNNNLVWNFVHVLVTQQLLCYALSGLKPKIDAEVINAYRKGTSPDKFVDEKTLEFYKKMTFETLNQFKKDIEANLFVRFNSYDSSFGLTLRNIQEATHFNLAHETMHLGVMMSMRKLL